MTVQEPPRFLQEKFLKFVAARKLILQVTSYVAMNLRTAREKSMSAVLDKFFTSSAAIRRISRSRGLVSECFYRVGQQKIGRHRNIILWHCSVGLEYFEVMGAISRAYHRTKRSPILRGLTTMLTFIGALVAGAFLPVPTGSALAEIPADNVRTCTAAHGKDAISICGTIIQRGALSKIQLVAALEARASAFVETGDYDDAIADYSSAIEPQPGTARLLLNRGIVQELNGGFDQAIADFTSAIALSPNDSDAFINRGLAYSKKGDKDRALADYDSAIRIDPTAAVPHVNRGIIYHERGDLVRAFADFNEALRLNPKDTYALNGRGYAYYDEKDYDHAIEDFNKSIELKPNNSRSYYLRALARIRKGDLDHAIGDLDNAIKIEPDYYYAYSERALAYDRQGNFARAIADGDQAIRLKPDSALAYNNRCYMRAESGQQLELALADCSRSLELQPGYSYALGSRGLVYLRLGRFDDAIVDLDSAVMRKNGAAEVLYARGIAKLRKGNKAGGELDVAAANAMDANAQFRFAEMGVVPTDLPIDWSKAHVVAFLLTAVATGEDERYRAGEHHPLVVFVRGETQFKASAALPAILTQKGWREWIVEESAFVGEKANSDENVRTARERGASVAVFPKLFTHEHVLTR